MEPKPKGEITRKKLTVISADEPRPYGSKGGTLVKFKAKNGDGKELTFTVFSKSLFEYIKPGAELDCEIDTSSREHEGNTYTDRTITQIFIGGEPVAQKKSYGGGYNRASIERQVCLKCACEVHGSTGVGDSAVDEILKAADRFYRWLSGNSPAKAGDRPAKSVPAGTNSDKMAQPKADPEWDAMERPQLPGSNEWILYTLMRLGISEAGFLEYLNKTLHLPVEDTVEKTLTKLVEKEQLKEAHRVSIVKALKQKEKELANK
jgi:hypothetical protein